MTAPAEARATIARRLRWQAGHCVRLGSELYGLLLESAAADVEAGGPAWRVLEGQERDPATSMPALRLMGAVHRLVLAGAAPDLAPYYGSVGGHREAAEAWPAFRSLLEECPEELRDLVPMPVQTNEVGRSAALVGGFLMCAARTGLPLRLLELGASAGLNLRFDRYLYTRGAMRWGDERSAVRFVDWFEGATPPLDVQAAIATRAGCDARPLDPASENDRLTLLSFVWPDQPERFELLRAALAIVAEGPAAVERADAVEWLERRLDQPAPEVATVVFHSIFAQYLDDEGRERMETALASAGARATAEAPLAWLRMEASGELADVRLTTWPGGKQSLIARAGYHGRPVQWLD